MYREVQKYKNNNNVFYKNGLNVGIHSHEGIHGDFV